MSCECADRNLLDEVMLTVLLKIKWTEQFSSQSTLMFQGLAHAQFFPIGSSSSSLEAVFVKTREMKVRILCCFMFHQWMEFTMFNRSMHKSLPLFHEISFILISLSLIVWLHNFSIESLLIQLLPKTTRFLLLKHIINSSKPFRYRAEKLFQIERL